MYCRLHGVPEDPLESSFRASHHLGSQPLCFPFEGEDSGGNLLQAPERLRLVEVPGER